MNFGWYKCSSWLHILVAGKVGRDLIVKIKITKGKNSANLSRIFAKNFMSASQNYTSYSEEWTRLQRILYVIPKHSINW